MLVLFNLSVVDTKQCFAQYDFGRKNHDLYIRTQLLDQYGKDKIQEYIEFYMLKAIFSDLCSPHYFIKAELFLLSSPEWILQLKETIKYVKKHSIKHSVLHVLGMF